MCDLGHGQQIYPSTWVTHFIHAAAFGIEGTEGNVCVADGPASVGDLLEADGLADQRLADITLIFPLDFLRLLLIAVVGWMLYAEALDPWTALGALIIFAGNYHSVREEV